MIEFTFSEIILVVVGYLILLYRGNLFVRVILKRFPLEHKNSDLRLGGSTIGYLERALIFTLLLNAYVIIDLVRNVKSIARFEELKNRIFAEYFLIGTLYSILFPFWVFLLLQSALN